MTRPYNPLALLSEEVLQGLIEKGHRYFIRQSFPRGMEPGIKEAFLISAYSDFSEATGHFEAIKYDTRKYLYEPTHAGEMEKLWIAARQPEGFRIYISLLATEDWYPHAALEDRIREFLKDPLEWPKGKTHITLILRYGELYFSLEHEKKTQMIALADVERRVGAHEDRWREKGA